MTGFNIDPDALEKAIKKLETPRDTAKSIADSALNLQPGELNAGDKITQSAQKKFVELANNKDAGSLHSSASEIHKKLDEKIEAYQATLEEYRRSEDAATVDASRINQQQ